MHIFGVQCLDCFVGLLDGKWLVAEIGRVVSRQPVFHFTHLFKE